MSTEIAFHKMVGAGNDFLLVDALRRRYASVKRAWPKVASAMCDRRYGIGADGLLVLEPSRKADARMRIFNADGSEAEMCGNGARCVATYLSAAGARRSARRTGNGHVSLETAAGLVTATLAGRRVKMRMSEPTQLRLAMAVDVEHRPLELDFVNTGVPHAVLAVASVERVDVCRLGRLLRYHPAFAPRGANVNFVEMVSRKAHRLRVRTYERGVEGETLACGTGVTASAVIHAIRQDATSRSTARVTYHIEVETRSGETLMVHVTLNGRGAARRVAEVVLEGSARWICQGRFSWPRR